MRKIALSLFAVSAVLVPVTAFALAGIGPRVAFEGTVQSLTITPDQESKEMGGVMTVLATNGQTVTVTLSDDARILFEGRRRSNRYKPADILTDMSVRISGYRLGTNTVIGSLVTILNIEKTATLTYNGTIQNISSTNMTIVLDNGETRTVTLTNETEVNINYQLFGPTALSFIGKHVFLTLNPQDTTQVRIMRITGKSTNY